MAKEDFLDSFYKVDPNADSKKKRGAPVRRKPGEVYCDTTYSITQRNLNYIAFRGLEFGTHSAYINMLVEKDREENPEKDRIAQDLRMAEMKRKSR